MIRSMTGYGKGERVLYGRKFSVEIKSVNHRYCEISIKLPKILNPLEERIKRELNARVKRGKIDVYINFESFSKDDVRVGVNAALLDSYIDALNRVKEDYGMEDGVTLALVSRIPDVFSIDKTPEGEDALSEMWEGLGAALSVALDNFVSMREREGESIRADLLAKIAGIGELIKKIEGRAPMVSEEFEKRLRARLEEALADAAIDEARLLQEAVIFADRICVDEELVRLGSHMRQFGDIMRSDEAVGRKLDFLLQEINREINTIGSKSNDLEMTRAVVELKSELEKVREQAQNLE